MGARTCAPRIPTLTKFYAPHGDIRQTRQYVVRLIHLPTRNLSGASVNHLRSDADIHGACSARSSPGSHKAESACKRIANATRHQIPGDFKRYLVPQPPNRIRHWLQMPANQDLVGRERAVWERYNCPAFIIAAGQHSRENGRWQSILSRALRRMVASFTGHQIARNSHWSSLYRWQRAQSLEIR